MSEIRAPARLDESVEDLVARLPEASAFLLGQGVVCIRCGEPAWATLGELIEEKGLDAQRILAELNTHLGLA